MPTKRIPLEPSERQRWLDVHLPYRIQALRGLEIYNAKGGLESELLQAFPAIFEGTLMNCRWAMSFLGLYVEPNSRILQQGSKGRQNDVFASDLSGSPIELSELSANERVLLTTVWEAANVASAHPVREGVHSIREEEKPVDAAAALLVSKIKAHVYEALKLPVPEWKP